MTRLFFEVGPDPIDHPTIRAYTENTGQRLTRWQIEMLRRMNGILIECRNNSLQARMRQANGR